MANIFRAPPDPDGAAPAQRLAQRLRDYQHVFASDAGQRVLADILRRGGVARTTWDDGRPGMELREGQRQLALYILGQTTANIARIDKLLMSGETTELFGDE